MRTLNLRNNQLGDEGCAALAAALVSNTSLTWLSLRCVMTSVTRAVMTCDVLVHVPWDPNHELLLSQPCVQQHALMHLYDSPDCSLSTSCSSNNCGAGGARALGEWLRQPECALQSLFMSE